MQSKGMLGYKSEEGQKSTRYYLRFHQTIIRAIELNNQIYGDSVGKDKKEKRIEHPLRVAGMTEEIAEQSLQEYHLNWLVGVLHDSQEDDPVIYGQRIEQVLQDLLPEEREVVIKYINQLSKDRSLSKGERKREQVERMDQLDLVPSYIKIFDKFDNCRRFISNACGKAPEELNGYYAVALVCYDKAIKKHTEIGKFLDPKIRSFFEGLRSRLGSKDKIRDYTQRYYAL